jgi:hypothetical protein
MKGHASLPGSQDIGGMAKVIRQVIKEDIPKPAAQDQGNDQDQVEVFKMNIKLLEIEFLYLVLDEQQCGSKPQDIHKAIPADLQGTNGEDYRIYLWKSEHSK